jgi:hypothetical protein
MHSICKSQAHFPLLKRPRTLSISEAAFLRRYLLFLAPDITPKFEDNAFSAIRNS